MHLEPGGRRPDLDGHVDRRPGGGAARASGRAAGAVEVVFHAIGGYSDSLPIADASRPVTIVAVGMNGRVLPRAHGYPARLLAPGYFGMKQPKWLERLEVVTEPHQGYWEQRGG